MQSKQYQQLRQKAAGMISPRMHPTHRMNCTHKLELNRHETEVDDLHRRPHNEVGLERRDVHVPELVGDRPTATSLCNRHDCEECTHTKRRKDELIESNSLQRWPELACLRHREGARQELEPLELNGGHAETVGHESGETLEVKGRWADFGVWHEVSSVEG